MLGHLLHWLFLNSLMGAQKLQCLPCQDKHIPVLDHLSTAVRLGSNKGIERIASRLGQVKLVTTLHVKEQRNSRN